jgi:LacI family transcriptional regulator, galactose operon repressor
VYATIKEVAKKAGVSIATVSRVFNNVGSVDRETRKRVERAAKDLRYVPNALGRSLSTRRTMSIGLLLPDLFGEFFSEVIRGADQTAQQNNYHLLVSSSHNNRDEIEAAIRMMRGRVDGLVIMSPHIEIETLNDYLPRALPAILLNCYVNDDGFDSITVDNYQGAFAMVSHLLSHRHTRIAIITGTEDNVDAAERLRGYRDAIKQGGGEWRSEYEVPGSFSESSGYDAVRKVLSIRDRPTAIFASNDATAIGAMSALRDNDIQIPSEIALAGFDDVPIARYLTPTLSSVRVDIARLGVIAIQQCLHAVVQANDHQKQHRILPITLSLRESCGCTD